MLRRRDMQRVLEYSRELWNRFRRRLNGVDQPAFLCLVVICQAITVLVTWRLWQIHRSPPMLPSLPLPELNLGVIILVSLAAIFVRPLAGVILHTIVILYSILIDQSRLQPEIVSMVILMWGSLRSPSLKLIARSHLVSLWFFAGLNKMLSVGYLTSLTLAHPRSSSRAALLPLVELALGLLALIPRSRNFAAALAFPVHITIFAFVLRGRPNSPILFWNLALAFAGFALISSWSKSLSSNLRQLNPVTASVALLILLSPIGFYFGIFDAYLSHHLYSRSVPTAIWYRASGKRESIDTWKTLNVPLPPEHRLYEAYFNASCERGDFLIIRDPRHWARWRGYAERRVDCVRQ